MSGAPSPAHGHTLFCDDIRQEVGGKVTLVGIYKAELIYLGKFPGKLSKLGLHVLFQQSMSEPLTPMRLKVFLPHEQEDGKASLEIDVNPTANPAMPGGRDETPDSVRQMIFNIIMGDVELRQEGLIRVRMHYDGKEARLGSLLVREHREDEKATEQS